MVKVFGTTRERGYAHNSFLEVWEELGLLGAVFYLLIFGSCTWMIVIRRVKFVKLESELNDKTVWFWETVFFYAFFESLFSLTVFSNEILWVSMGMVVMSDKYKQDKYSMLKV